MQNWVRSLLRPIHAVLGTKKTSSKAKAARQRCRPTLECLEDRCVPSTMSSIAGNFNGTAIPAGDTVWFNSSLTATGLPKGAAATVHVVNQSIDFTAGGAAYHLAVPNGVIVFNPGATSASTSFDPSDNDWDVSVPSGGSGDVFMGGVGLQVPNGLPGGIKNITWNAGFWSDTAGITVNWNWAAAAYKNFSTDYNVIGVKPVDNNSLSIYHNGDQSGAPEAYKSFVVAGATGAGGSNYTGNFTSAVGVKPTLGDGVQDYPFTSSNPLTSVAFNESSVLKAANLDLANGVFEVWYSDEHALALGVGQVIVKTSSGATTTNYPIAALTSNPGVALNPAVGTTATTGDQAGTDVSGRPMAPSLFITDITNNRNNRSGDWQYGGAATAPSAVFGTWKSFTRTVDKTTSTPTVTVTVGVDPVKNNWNLGAGSDPAPAGLTNEGYGAEVRWSLDDLRAKGVLVAGHKYRFYVIVHDGDQNKTGGDAGQASFDYFYPGPVNQPAAISGHVTSPVGPLVSVTITLSGIDVHGIAVNITAVTDAFGYYQFTNVAPGTYSLSDNATLGYQPNSATAGTVKGVTDGTNGIDQIGGISLRSGDIGINFDFFQMWVLPS